jgi:hypothetical protein
LTNEKHAGGTGRNAGWGAGDEESAPFEGRGRGPVRYLDDVPEDHWGRGKLFWFLYPTVLIALGIWWALNHWLHLPEWTGWVFVGVSMAIYVVIGMLGPHLLLFGSRLRGRQSKLSRASRPPR